MNSESTPRDVSAQLRCLRSEGALSVIEDSIILEVSGADRHRFLNGFVTAEVKSREPGDSFFTFFTDVKGKVIAEGFATVDEDGIYLEVPREQGSFLTEHLRKYVIADRVELHLRDWQGLRLWGPQALEIAKTHGVILEGTKASSPDSMGLRLAEHRQRYGLSCLCLWFEDSRRDEWAQRIQDQGIAWVSQEAVEIHRVEKAVPKWGQDYGLDNLPQETGLENRAVSYEKGCYLGQEIVARIHYRGGVQRKMVRLRLQAAASAGQVLEHDGRPCGSLGSVVESPTEGWIALAIVHQRGAEPNSVLSWPGGQGKVVEVVSSSS